MIQRQLQPPFAAVIVCSSCGGGMIAHTRLLQCQECGREVSQTLEDWFYMFTEGLPKQGRSLLVHEQPMTNPWITRFAVDLNISELQTVLARYRPNSVVDVGCGGGEYSEALAGQYRSYYGLEPSPIPENRRLSHRPPENVILIRNDPARPLPIRKGSVDMVMFIASYDHIPNRTQVLLQAWNALKPGGHLLVNMTNYGFWAKRALGSVLRRPVARHEHEHYCVHDPSTLDAEVAANCSGATMSDCRADYMYVPNTPLTWLYRSKSVLKAANWLLRTALYRILGCEHWGSPMICVFQKRP